MNYLFKVSSKHPPSRNDSRKSIVVPPFEFGCVHTASRHRSKVRSDDNGEIGYEDGGSSLKASSLDTGRERGSETDHY